MGVPFFVLCERRCLVLEKLFQVSTFLKIIVDLSALFILPCRRGALDSLASLSRGLDLYSALRLLPISRVSGIRNQSSWSCNPIITLRHAHKASLTDPINPRNASSHLPPSHQTPGSPYHLLLPCHSCHHLNSYHHSLVSCNSHKHILHQRRSF